MELQNVFIAALLFVLMITGFGLFYSSMVTTYSPTINSTYDNFTASLEKTRTDLAIFDSESGNKITNTSGGDTAQTNMIQAGWSILKAIPNTFNNIKSMIGETIKVISPEGSGTIFGIIGIIIGIAMIFAIIAIIFQRSWF